MLQCVYTPFPKEDGQENTSIMNVFVTGDNLAELRINIITMLQRMWKKQLTQFNYETFDDLPSMKTKESPFINFGDSSDVPPLVDIVHVNYNWLGELCDVDYDEEDENYDYYFDGWDISQTFKPLLDQAFEELPQTSNIMFKISQLEE